MKDSPGMPGQRQDEHADEMLLLLYVDGQLDRRRAQEVSAHTQDCASCKTLLRSLERESRLLTRAMLEEDEALPSRLAAFQEHAKKSMQWIWGAVLGLAATGAYAFYTGYIEPMEQRFEQAGFGGSSVLNLMIFQGAFWKGWQSMLTLFEVLALVTIVGSAVMFFRRRLRRGSVFAMIAVGLCAAVLMPSATRATDFRKGDTVEVAKDEIIKGDIFLSGHHVKIDGTVEGDAFVFTQNADITGHVKGDLIAFAQVVRVGGQIDGNVRSFTNTTLLTGTVAKNVLSFSETITIDGTGKIGGSLTTFINSLTVDGRLGRDLLVFSKTTSVSGNVGGEIRAKGDTLRFGPGAQVDGKIKFEGNYPPDVPASAKLASPPEFTKMQHHNDYSEGKFYVWKLIWTAGAILFGLVLFLLMPSFARESVDSAERYGASFGLGVLVMFGIPIAAGIACLTIVGLFIGISAFFIWIAGLFCAKLIVGTIVGQWLMGRTRETWHLIGRMVVGVILIRVAQMIPHLGFWVSLAVLLWGMGAISLAVYRRFSPSAPLSNPPAYVPPSPLPPNTTIGTPQPAL